MGRKVRTSEYQRSFQEPARDYCKTWHEELYTYRNQRRQLEFAHEKIKWDSSDSSESNSSAPSPGPEQQNPETEHQGEETTQQLENDSSDDTEVEQQEKDDSEVLENVIEEEKPKSTAQITAEPKHTPKQEGVEKAPFVPYGWADRELETARKFTHNVRADNRYVYPSALKKQKLVKSRKLHHEEARAESRASVAAMLQSRQKAIANDIWMTEYQRCYSRASTRPATAGMEDVRKKAIGEKRARRARSR